MELTTWILLAFALAVEGSVIIDSRNGPNHSFAVDYENNQFLLDGSPFRYVSGSFHYFRTPKVYWRDRLRKLRAAGLNAVSTYVEWSLHQPMPDVWNWEDDADLVYFLTLAKEEDLFVLLRPGPYICAERDFGGFPFWLLNIVPDIRLRTNDPRYMRYVTIYIEELMKRVRPFLRGNGGPIIMVQVENEYGSYGACDLSYMSQLRDLFFTYIGDDALLYTTDGPTNRMLRCGVVPQVYSTVDFGVGSNVTESFAVMRLFQPRGPFVNSEFYSGWLTHWEEPWQRVSASSVAAKLDEILSTGASVNIYMFYGGTNFGFTSGANTDPNYRPQLTSYDYDAPITEAGDLTQKYFKIKNIVSKYLPIPNISLPPPSQKGDYGIVSMKPSLPLFHPFIRELIGISRLMQHTPPTFESLGIPLALVLYETYLPYNHSDPSVINVSFIHDRALVYEDNRFVGSLSRSHKVASIALSMPYSRCLKILVENQGHINYGNAIHDFKGIGNVTLNDLPLSNWNVTGFRLPWNHIGNPQNLQNTTTPNGLLDGGPVFFYSEFTVPDTPLDTFLDLTGWGKGVAAINGFNLGRYWPAGGPQITLYVPASILKSGENHINILEFEYVPLNKKVRFLTVPKISVPERK